MENENNLWIYVWILWKLHVTTGLWDSILARDRALNVEYHLGVFFSM